MADNRSVLNIYKARECCLRENDLCGNTETCKRCPYMKRVKELWVSFCDTPVVYELCTIAEEWNNFPIGTARRDIVYWFRQIYEVDMLSLEKITGRVYNLRYFPKEGELK